MPPLAFKFSFFLAIRQLQIPPFLERIRRRWLLSSSCKLDCAKPWCQPAALLIPDFLLVLLCCALAVDGQYLRSVDRTSVVVFFLLSFYYYSFPPFYLLRSRQVKV